MLKERTRRYYLDEDYNCAESLLRACNDEYALQLDENALLLASGFGKGMGAESVCGLLLVSEAVIGRLFVQGRAHATPGFTKLCAEFVREFETQLSSCQCSELRQKLLRPDIRCFATVEQAAELLENFIAQKKAC